MAPSAESRPNIVLQPTLANHVSRRELSERPPAPAPPSRPDVGHLLAPTLVILIALCAIAALVLLVVNWRLAAAGDGRGSLARVDGARDVFDGWIRPMIYVAGTAAAVLSVAWVRRRPDRRTPTIRTSLVVAAIGGFAAATLTGALIGGETVDAARRANLAAIASFFMLAASCLIMLTELRTQQLDPAGGGPNGGARADGDQAAGVHNYRPLL